MKISRARDGKRSLVFVHRRFSNWICFFGWLPDGRQFQATRIKNGRWVVTAVEAGTRRDKEGTKVVWESISPDRRFEVAV